MVPSEMESWHREWLRVAERKNIDERELLGREGNLLAARSKSCSKVADGVRRRRKWVPRGSFPWRLILLGEENDGKK